VPVLSGSVRKEHKIYKITKTRPPWTRTKTKLSFHDSSRDVTTVTSNCVTTRTCPSYDVTDVIAAGCCECRLGFGSQPKIEFEHFLQLRLVATDRGTLGGAWPRVRGDCTPSHSPPIGQGRPRPSSRSNMRFIKCRKT
jgi:hypothetical protein